MLGLGATTGCSKSADTPAVEAAAAVQIDPPDVAVRQFLEAIRVGNHKQAEGMLTDLARQKTAEADLMVAPPGSPTAKFEIAEMEIIENQVAHVACVWTDVGDDGKPQSNEFVWALRLQPVGWRIAGVAVQLFPNQPPLLLDFEDPADMLRKQQMAEAEARRQMNPQNVQAGGTAGVAAGTPGAVVPTGATAPAGSQPAGSAGFGSTPELLQGTAPEAGQSQR
jgi:hypothetical protein